MIAVSTKYGPGAVANPESFKAGQITRLKAKQLAGSPSRALTTHVLAAESK